MVIPFTKGAARLKESLEEIMGSRIFCTTSFKCKYNHAKKVKESLGGKTHQSQQSSIRGHLFSGMTPADLYF